jgi:hypothetical protein
MNTAIKDTTHRAGAAGGGGGGKEVRTLHESIVAMDPARLERYFSTLKPLKRVILLVDSDTHEVAEALCRKLEMSVVLRLPDPSTSTAGGVMDALRVAMTAFDLARKMSPEFVLIPNVCECVFMNKSLPANIATLKHAPGRCAVFLFDAREEDVRLALSRRDFIRSIGPVLFDVETAYDANQTSKTREKELRSYLEKVHRRCCSSSSSSSKVAKSAAADDDDDEPTASSALDEGSSSEDPWNVYESIDDVKGLSRKTLETFVSSFRTSSIVEKKANGSRDYYALVFLADGIRQASIESIAEFVGRAKKTSQMQTRCGLHANLCQDVASAAADAGRSTAAILADATSVQAKRLATTVDSLRRKNK